ncbi:MAG: NAD-dependent epimerase/dehydratase family protein [Thermodesulfobacteriota bacterium]
MHKLHQANQTGEKSVTIWGTGAPTREFIFVDDLAEACLLLMERYDEDAPINIGTSESLSIAELAERIKALTGFSGTLDYDTFRPDGMMRKELDSTRLLAMGWTPSHTFDQALETTYDWHLSQQNHSAGA